MPILRNLCMALLLLFCGLAGACGGSSVAADASGDGTSQLDASDQITVSDSSAVDASDAADTQSPNDSDAASDVGVDGADDASDSADVAPPPPKEVEILFVVDNSGTMHHEQGRLAKAIGSLTSKLMAAKIAFRVAVTTTDNGNPWCGATTPEKGALVLSSCRSRLSSFTFEGAQTVDGSDVACKSVCKHDALTITPTTTSVDSTAKPRPWVQWDGTSSNVSGVTVDEALACALPQGINGCGFESPLESMHQAIMRTLNTLNPEFGFLRAGTHLVVVFVSDEVDCSYNPAHETIFLPDGNKVFWSDSSAPAPNSALCWNAGVSCTGTGNPFDECHAVTLDEAGSPTTVEDDAVLYPVSRYVSVLKQAIALKAPGQVRVRGLLGVGNNGNPLYMNGSDSAQISFQENYGIAPGCELTDTQAVPPVRLLELAKQVNPPNDTAFESVCYADYGPYMEKLADEIISWSTP